MSTMLEKWRGYSLGEGLPSEAGSKARHLDLARAKGLPVPEGRAYVVAEPTPAVSEEIADDLQRHLSGGTLAVRSSFPSEDGDSSSQAGRFETRLRVSPDEVARAVREVLESGAEFPTRGVVIQRMVEARQAGVMFLQRDFLDPLVSFTEGTAENLVGGTEAGTTLALTPGLKGDLIRWRRFGESVLQSLGPGRLGWDVEWADDGTTVWLVQARPITQPPLRDELFSYANIREIMPDPPSHFMTSVVEKAGPELYQYYRHFDPDLPATRPLVEVHLGRPLFNISLLAETMRHWGLPTRLVTDQIGGADVGEVGFDLARFLSKLGPISRQSLAQFSAVAAASDEMKELRRFQPADTLTALGEQAVQLFQRLVTVMLNLTAALAVPLSLLRKLGVLAEHGAGHRTPTGRLLTALEPLRELAHSHPEWDQELMEGCLPADLEFRRRWREYLNQFGHRGFFESDLAEPRFVEAPEIVLSSLLSPSPRAHPVRKTLRGRLTRPLWIYTRRILDTRELWRDEAMKAYLRLRQAILRRAQELQFEAIDRVFDLSLEEWNRIEQGWTPEQDFWKRRDDYRRELCSYEVPDLLRRFQSRAEFLPQASELASDRVYGLALTRGTVEGTVWLARDARDVPGPEVEPETTVLVTRTVDPAWLFHLPRVAGVIVELGGDLSHGSILLREFGVPAITNAAGATRLFASGDRVRLVAGEGYAVKL